MPWTTSITQLSGTPEKPIHTYGGDTVLRIPTSAGADKQFLSDIQNKVAEVYFEADKYEGSDRIDFLRNTLQSMGWITPVEDGKIHTRSLVDCLTA